MNPPKIKGVSWFESLNGVWQAFVTDENDGSYELTWTESDPNIIGWAQYVCASGRVMYGNSGCDDVNDINNVLGKLHDVERASGNV